MTFPLRFHLAVSLLLLVTSTSRAADLFDALNKSDAAGVATMLKADPKLANKPDANGNPPLHFALHRNMNIKIIQLLVDAGAEVNALDSNGSSPMHMAAANKNKAVIELLIARDAKIDVAAKNLDAWTPLHVAAGAGNKPVLALLLDKGARVDGGINPNKSAPRTTPLYEAVASRHLRTAEFLLSKGANPNTKGPAAGYSPLLKAVENRDLDMIRLLLANGADVDSEIPFQHALASYDRELVEVFLKRGIDVKKPRYLIQAATQSKELTELLLDHGANPRLTEQGYSPLMSAAGRGNATIVALLLARGASAKDVDGQNQTALHFASNATIAELLLASGADVNATATDGATPLHNALLLGQKDFVEMLVKRGAKLDAFSMAALGRADELRTYLKDKPIPKPTNWSLTSALHLAARFGQNETLAVLLDKGADLESKTSTGQTPLHFAAQGGRKTTVEFLLKKGANIESKTRDGQTSLHLAAEGGQKAMVELLLKGADINAKTAKDTFGPRSQTPLQLALAADQAEVVRLLVDKGAAPKLEGQTAKLWWESACRSKQRSLLRYFVEQGLATTGEELTAALLVAAEVGDLDLVKLLVSKGAEFKSAESSPQTPLVAAARGHQKAVVEYLLANGADADDRYALREAVSGGHKDLVELLVSKGASLKGQVGSRYGIEPLHGAVLAGRLDIVKLLLDKGADPKKDETLLHLAALGGHKPIVEALLAAGMDVNATSLNGSDLYEWRFQKRPDILEEMLNFFKERDLKKLRGVPIPEPRDEDWGHVVTGTPLQAAVAGKCKDVAELLLAHGAKVDAQLPGGATALHLAAYHGDIEMAKMLLANKADLSAKDNAGVTALRLAEREGRKEMAAFLRKQGAKE